MRKHRKKVALLLVLLCSFLVILAGCSPSKEEPNANTADAGNRKVRIVTTLFPQYDFARQIAGDKAEITLLLPLGMESHSYEPTPADMISINKADLFLYTGEYMEGWAAGLLDSLDNAELQVLDVSKGVVLDKEEEHDHGAETEEHDHEYDPHIWTSPINAKQMVRNITESLCQVDPDNASYYQEREKAYQSELDGLDAEIRDIVAAGTRKELFFGGRFPFHYFFAEYGLEYEAAYDNCSNETEPSVGTMTHMIAEMREQQSPVVYYEELTDPKIARTIREETGAEMLLFHSCHNVSKEDFDNGVTYLELMRQNAEALKKGLQ